MTSQEKIREIIWLTWKRFDGTITQDQLSYRVGQIVAPDPELPLGLGAPTEAPK